MKAIRGIKLDKDLNVDARLRCEYLEQLKLLVARFKNAIKDQTGSDFLSDPMPFNSGVLSAPYSAHG